MSDKWKAYDCLQDEGYQHLPVKHSLNFVDPDTGAHTQGIENTWWGVKRGMPRTGLIKTRGLIKTPSKDSTHRIARRKKNQTAERKKGKQHKR